VPCRASRLTGLRRIGGTGVNFLTRKRPLKPHKKPYDRVMFIAL
jgi:hypothetical protein